MIFVYSGMKKNTGSSIPHFIPPPLAGSSMASNVTNSVDGLVGGQLADKKKKEKKKTVVRVAGSSVWEDETLLEWDPSTNFFHLLFLHLFHSNLLSEM